MRFLPKFTKTFENPNIKLIKEENYNPEDFFSAIKIKENPELVSNTKAEKEFTAYITKLDKQQLSLQKQLTNKEDKLAKSNGVDKSKLEKLLARKEFIYNEIAKMFGRR